MLRETHGYSSQTAIAISNQSRLTTTLLALPISLMIAVICIGQAQAQRVLPSPPSSGSDESSDDGNIFTEFGDYFLFGENSLGQKSAYGDRFIGPKQILDPNFTQADLDARNRLRDRATAAGDAAIGGAGLIAGGLDPAEAATSAAVGAGVDAATNGPASTGTKPKPKPSGSNGSGSSSSGEDENPPTTSGSGTKKPRIRLDGLLRGVHNANVADARKAAERRRAKARERAHTSTTRTPTGRGTITRSRATDSANLRRTTDARGDRRMMRQTNRR